MSSKMSIYIILPWFGDWPSWMDYFLLSCRHNMDITWLMLTDAKKPPSLPANIQYHPLSLNEFNQLASRKLAVQVRIDNHYKICDFRPAFGCIFEDLLEKAAFWGYSDLDLVYGNIRRFLTDELLGKYDVISTRKEYLAGHFCIYRNDTRINQLFRLSPVYKQVFEDSSRHYAFDERSNIFGKRLDDSATWFEKTRNRMISIFGTADSGHPADMDEITRQESGQNRLRLFKKDMVRSDLWFRKKRMDKWEIIWENGSLKDNHKGKELLHFHFISSKHDPGFEVALPLRGDGFRISQEGISSIRR